MTSLLIVDDELDMRMLVRLVVKMANHGLRVVGEAADGVEAVKAFHDLHGPPDPDVIILDNRMPRQDGLETARQIISVRPEQIIVLYSAYLDDSTREKAREIGIAACVAKNEVDRLPSVVIELTGEAA